VTDTIHTVPINDLIEHYSDGRDCPCGPETIPVERDDGSIAFQLVHHALDGREHFEDGPVADTMGLRDWTFDVLIGDPATDVPGVEAAFASIECVDGRKYASITFHPAIRDEPLEEIRDTVAHELIHAHLNPACEIVRVDACDLMQQDTYEVLMAGFRRNVEFAVDALAGALAPSLPLIDWQK
jgi:hypothetical protein